MPLAFIDCSDIGIHNHMTLHKAHDVLLLILLLTSLPALATTNAKGVTISFIGQETTDHGYYPDYDLSLDKALTEPIVDLANYPPAQIDPYQNNIWLRIQAGYAMPDIDSPYTSKYETYYSKRPKYVKDMMERSSKYLFYVVTEIEKRGMPTELALLPMIESAYNPQAYSRSHAAGIWQFVPSTGKHFGLQQNWWRDNRRDVIAATEAALDYLEKLHNMFGSWDLALAAYNAGEGTVGRAIEANRRKKLATDYQSLKLPLETTHYVPKLQAIKNIVNHPERYGLNIAPIPNSIYFQEISISQQIDAKLAAELADISQEEFNLLNPSYNRPIVASKNHSDTILLPIDAVSRFEKNMSTYNDSLLSWKVYSAKQGERIATIAKKFKISTDKLRRTNSLPSQSTLSRNMHILVPSEDPNTSNINITKLSSQTTEFQHSRHNNVRHRIRRGETLSTIAKRYGTSTKSIMQLNRLRSTRIKIGQVLKVNGKSTKRHITTYKIRPGDTLSAIAKKYGTNTKQLMKINQLRSTQLKVGQTLKVQG